MLQRAMIAGSAAQHGRGRHFKPYPSLSVTHGKNDSNGKASQGLRQIESSQMMASNHNTLGLTSHSRAIRKQPGCTIVNNAGEAHRL